MDQRPVRRRERTPPKAAQRIAKHCCLERRERNGPAEPQPFDSVLDYPAPIPQELLAKYLGLLHARRAKLMDHASKAGRTTTHSARMRILEQAEEAIPRVGAGRQNQRAK